MSIDKKQFDDDVFKLSFSLQNQKREFYKQLEEAKEDEAIYIPLKTMIVMIKPVKKGSEIE